MCERARAEPGCGLQFWVVTQPGRGGASVERVRASLAAHGLDAARITFFDESTATAVDAAAAIGTRVECIVKSLVFVAGAAPVLVLASGPNRVDTGKVSALVGEPIARANANQVREFTGFAIGGVPPVGHTSPLQTLVDASLLDYAEVWAAAGRPNAVFPIDPHMLVAITRGRIADVTVDAVSPTP